MLQAHTQRSPRPAGHHGTRFLDVDGRVRFEGLENEGATLIGNVDGVRTRYRDRVEAHRLGLRDLARSLGWTLASHVTDHPPEPPLLALYNALSTKAQG